MKKKKKKRDNNKTQTALCNPGQFVPMARTVLLSGTIMPALLYPPATSAIDEIHSSGVTSSSSSSPPALPFFLNHLHFPPARRRETTAGSR